MKKNLVILSGAGISAESGIKTFRDSDGLWEGYHVEDVATPEGFTRNPQLVLNFYNERRSQLHAVQPNMGHLIIAELEDYFNVQIITQNVDNLHEKAGSTNVLHLHGQLFQVRSSKNPSHILQWEKDLNLGDLCPKGGQLRPNIVWFGEDVPELQYAVQLIENADFLIIIGTSLQVYPAAGLLHFAKSAIPIFYIDPKPASIASAPLNLTTIAQKGSQGMQIVRDKLLKMN